MAAVQQIFAFSGMLESDGDQRTNSALTRFAWSLTGKPNGQRVCYVPTALGDSSAAIEAKTREFNSEHPSAHLSTFTVFPQPNVADVRGHLMGQDLIMVEGGSVVNLVAAWRAHALGTSCGRAGRVESSWPGRGPAASVGTPAASRTRIATRLIRSRAACACCLTATESTTTMRGSPGGWHTDGSSLMTLWPGHATDDGVGLHYIGTTLHEDVTIREGSPARYVEPAGDGETTEIVMSARLL